jgi:hypothetical protein
VPCRAVAIAAAAHLILPEERRLDLRTIQQTDLKARLRCPLTDRCATPALPR